MARRKTAISAICSNCVSGSNIFNGDTVVICCNELEVIDDAAVDFNVYVRNGMVVRRNAFVICNIFFLFCLGKLFTSFASFSKEKFSLVSTLNEFL